MLYLGNHLMPKKLQEDEKRFFYERNFYIDSEDVKAYCELTGDMNPIHLSEFYAANTRFKRRIAPGMLIGGFITSVITNEWPGKGTAIIEQNLNFFLPSFIGDTLTISLYPTVVKEKVSSVDCMVFNEERKEICSGEFILLMPSAVLCERAVE